MWLGQFRWRRRRPAARHVKVLACLGWFWPRTAGVVLSFSLLAACAVGPDFKPPQAPPVSGYTPETTPATTTVGRRRRRRGAKVRHRPRHPGRVVEGVPFEGDRRADRRSAARQSEPSGCASGLVAGEGEPLRLRRQTAAQRRRRWLRHPSAILGGGIRLDRPAIHFHPLPSHRERRLYARRVRRPAATDRGQRGAGRVSTLRARGDLPDAHRERGDGGDSGSVAARADRGDPRNHQGGNRPARRRAQSVRSRRRQPRRRADPAIGGGDDAGDVAAAAEATGAAAPCAAGVDRPLSEPGARRITCNSHRCGCRRRCRSVCPPTRRAAPGRARRRSAIASGQRPDRRRHRQQAAAIKSHRAVRQHRFDAGGAVHPGHRRLESRRRRHATDLPRLYALASGTRGQGRLRNGGSAISQYRARGVPERRRRAAGAAIGRRHAQGAAARRGARHRIHSTSRAASTGWARSPM